MLSMMGKNSTGKNLKYFTYFFQKIGLDISCLMPPKEKICMKYQSLFSETNRKNSSLSSAELAHLGKMLSMMDKPLSR